MKRITSLLIIACTLLSLSLWLMPASAHAAAAQAVAGYSSGYAHGAYATLPLNSPGNNSTTSLGPLAPVWEGCDTAPSVTGNNSTSSASLSTLMSVNSTQSTVTTQRSSAAISAHATSNVQGVNILNGLITAGQITTVANTTGTATSDVSDEIGSKITGLAVSGLSPIDVLPAPNTTIQLPGVGYVVLNEVIGPYNGNGSTVGSINVNMIHVYITSSAIPGAPAGSDIIVGHASSNFFPTLAPALINASSSALSMAGNSNSNTVSMTPVGLTQIGCGAGTSQSNINSSQFSNLGTTGTVNDSSSGQIGASNINATSQSNTSSLNLLNGLINGPLVTSTAQANWNGSGSGSTSVNLSNLSIAGNMVTSTPQPNTRVDIPGLGYAILNEQYSTITSSGVNEDVNAIDVVVTVANNTYGLAVGQRLIVGYSTANISAYA